MAVDNLRNRFQTLNHLVKLRGVIEDKSYIGAGLVADRSRVYDGLKTADYACGCQFLYALMDGGAGNICLAGNL